MASSEVISCTVKTSSSSKTTSLDTEMLTHDSVVEGWNVITDTIGVKSFGPAENVYCVCNIIISTHVEIKLTNLEQFLAQLTVSQLWSFQSPHLRLYTPQEDSILH